MKTRDLQSFLMLKAGDRINVTGYDVLHNGSYLVLKAGDTSAVVEKMPPLPEPKLVLDGGPPRNRHERRKAKKEKRRAN